MKHNLFVAYNEYDEVPYIYFEDKETSDLTKVDFGNEPYAFSDTLEAMVYGENSLPAYPTDTLNDEDVKKIYENFTYDPRTEYDHPPLSKVFEGTSVAKDFS